MLSTFPNEVMHESQVEEVTQPQLCTSEDKKHSEELKLPISNKNNGSMLHSIETLDKDILKIESTLLMLKKNENEILETLQCLRVKLQAIKEKRSEKSFIEKHLSSKSELQLKLLERFSYRDMDTIKRIYSENQAKAAASHGLKFFNKDMEQYKLPLYNNPSDLPQYQHNIKSFQNFRPRLLRFLQRKKITENKMLALSEQSYADTKKNWLKKVDKLENNQKRRQKVQRVRQFYEKEFPEIKKLREQQERIDRLGSRAVGAGYVRSEAEIEEITEINANKNRVKLFSIQTPKLLNNYERRFRFLNYNSLIQDVDVFEIQRKSAILWSDKEKQIFREKFTQFPKDFEKIASFLEQKKCADCVLFYYQNKKKEGFKSSKLKSKKKGKLNKSENKITLRMEKSKPSKSEREDDDEGNESAASDEENLESCQVKQVSISNADLVMIKKPCTLTTCTIESSTKTTTVVPDAINYETQGLENKPITENKSVCEKPKKMIFLNDTSKELKSPQPLVKVFNTRSGKLTKKTAKLSLMLEDSFEATPSEVPNPPLKITISVTSPSCIDVGNPALPSCSIISETVTAALVLSNPDDVPIENSVIKVEDLIRQHFSTMPEHSDPSRWSEQEMLKAVEGLKKYGRSWPLIAKIVESKSEGQCKNFYFNYKKKFNLDKILGIYKQKDDSNCLEEEGNDDDSKTHFVFELKKTDDLNKVYKKTSKIDEEISHFQSEASENIFGEDSVIRESIQDQSENQKSIESSIKNVHIINATTEDRADESKASDFSSKPAILRPPPLALTPSEDTGIESVLVLKNEELSNNHLSSTSLENLNKQENFKGDSNYSHNYHFYIKKEQLSHKQPTSESSPNHPIVHPFKMLQHKHAEQTCHQNLSYQYKQNDSFQLSTNPLFSNNRGNSIFSHNHVALNSPNKSASDFCEMHKHVSPDALRQPSSFFQKESLQNQETHLSAPRQNTFPTFMTHHHGAGDQKSAINPFTPRFPGYMSSLQLHGVSSDTPYARFRLPLSPSDNTSRMSSPLSSQFPQVLSPMINLNRSTQMQHSMQHSPMQHSPVQLFFNTYSLEDSQKQHDVDLIHCQRDREFDLDTRCKPDLVLKRDIQSEVSHKLNEESQKSMHSFRMKEIDEQSRRHINHSLYDRKRSGDINLNQHHYQIENVDYHHKDSIKDSDEFLRHLPYQPRSKTERIERSAFIPELQRHSLKSRESHGFKADRRKFSEPCVDSSSRYPVFLNDRKLFENQRQIIKDEYSNVKNQTFGIQNISSDALPRSCTDGMVGNIDEKKGSSMEISGNRAFNLSLAASIAAASPTKFHSNAKSLHKSHTYPSLSRNQMPPFLHRQATPPVVGFIGPGVLRENEVGNIKQNAAKIVRPWEMNSDISQRNEINNTSISNQNLSPRVNINAVELQNSYSLLANNELSDNSFLINRFSQPFDSQKEMQSTNKSFKSSPTVGVDCPVNMLGKKEHRQTPNELNCPVIQLAPTSVKFKEQIISFAQYNSPTPQSFPKFPFNDSSEINVNFPTNKHLISQSVCFTDLTIPEKDVSSVNLSQSEQHSYRKSLVSIEDKPAFESPQSEHISRLRSDSEETVSSDELDKGLSQECLEPSLLIQRLLNKNDDEFPNVEPDGKSLSVTSKTRNRTADNLKCNTGSQEILSGRDDVMKDCASFHKPKYLPEPLASNFTTENIEIKKQTTCSANNFRFSEKETLLDNKICVVDKTESPHTVYRYETSKKMDKSFSSENFDKPKMKRCDSPDIYDDLKVHNYEEQRAESPTDLYIAENLQPRETAIFVKKSLKTDDLFYILSQDILVKENNVECSKDSFLKEHIETNQGLNNGDKEIEVINSKIETDPNKSHRSDASTPVMDEPINDTSDPLLINNENCIASLPCASPSTPEAHTPLLDEPAYSFEQTEELSTHFSGSNFEKFMTSSATTSSHCLKSEVAAENTSSSLFMRSDKYTHPKNDTAQKDGVFESISPPCSPEPVSCNLPLSNSSIIAFPFSALAFNVNSSRPGSRSSIHSPLPLEGTSPRVDDYRSKQRRDSHDPENKEFDQTSNQHFEGKKLLQKTYQRSMSQSSSNNSSKSPEYEYKSKNKQSGKFSHSVGKRPFHERRYDQVRSYKRHSRSPENERNKRIRK
ncbi:uncharacterized protein LOC101236675 isoform X2 [Hydra vulgaris]|uniref:Uncharacterized protein LOC101236675 isoform X2 n=1 Tax=Hydra vulgaris TaxID=6087 RepID=A0ABM4BBP1_HYDVU